MCYLLYCIHYNRRPHVKGAPRAKSAHHSFSPSMTKRHGDSTHGVNVKFKKQKGVKVRTVSIPDSDEEGLTPNVEIEYARLLKTRATTSGKVDSVTMDNLKLFEAKAAAHNEPSDPLTDTHEEFVAETIPIKIAKKRRKKANDSVRSILFY